VFSAARPANFRDVKNLPPRAFLLLAGLAAPRVLALDLPPDSVRSEAPDAGSPEADPYVPPPEVAVYWQEPARARVLRGPEPARARVLRGPEPSMLAEARMAAALFDDFQFGGRLDVHLEARRSSLGFLLDVEGRPFGNAVRVRESETLEYQFREHRFTLSPGLSWSLPMNRGEGWWTFATGVGLSFGTYRGSSRPAETTFPVWFETGYRAMIGGSQYLGIAYQYFPLPDVSPHRISVQWGLRSNPQNSTRESP
jgi:hypothetical protein